MALQTRNRFITVNITRDTMPSTVDGTLPTTLLFVGADMPHEYFDNATDAVSALEGLSTEDNDLSVAVNVIKNMFAQEHHPKIGVMGVSAEESISTVLEAEEPFVDSYRIVTSGTTEVGRDLIAEYVKGKALFYYANFDDVDEYEAFAVANDDNDNVVGFVHDREGQNLAAAAASLASGNFFGDWWMEFKNLVGISPNTFTKRENDKILEYNGTVYIREARRNLLTGSKVVSGEYVDIVETEHYLVDEIIKKMFSILSTTKKIPYTQKGIDLFEGGLRNVLDLATDRGVLATDENDNAVYKVSTPLRTSVDTDYIKNRILPDVKFVAVPTGAIGKVEINGTLTFDMEVAQ